MTNLNFENTEAFALGLDQKDSLRTWRESFFIPQHNGHDLIYFCGNSLGLQPRKSAFFLDKEQQTWQNHGVEGWFEGSEPWLDYHAFCKNTLADIMGALPVEVCPMNSLTVNMHLALTSFYQPNAKKFKILSIGSDFPSDQYALETHLKTRGYDPAHALIEICPRPDEHLIRNEDILLMVEQNADSMAMVWLSGVHYYTGQLFDLATIAKKCAELGITIGLDLAHAVGNVPLKLHEWGIDCAVWCSYKYLNSGPGGVAGLFVHKKHHATNLPRLAGWWGYDQPTRFEMTKGFVPMNGADGWQISTPNVLSLAVQRGALAVFEVVSMEQLRQKSMNLTGFLAFILSNFEPTIQVITPKNPRERGCQLSLLVEKNGKDCFDFLLQNGIVGDWREPNCIRMAPTPLYNSFWEVWQVGQVLQKYFQH